MCFFGTFLSLTPHFTFWVFSLSSEGFTLSPFLFSLQQSHPSSGFTVYPVHSPFSTSSLVSVLGFFIYSADFMESSLWARQYSRCWSRCRCGPCSRMLMWKWRWQCREDASVGWSSCPWELTSDVCSTSLSGWHQALKLSLPKAEFMTCLLSLQSVPALEYSRIFYQSKWCYHPPPGSHL